MAKNVKLPIVIALVVAGLLACGAFIYFQLAGGMTPDKPVAVLTPPPAAPPLPAEPGPEVELPALDASDELFRSLAQTLSEHPRLAAWLAPDHLIRRLVAAVVDVTNDESPRPHVGYLKPEGAFSVRDQEGALTIDPGSYARYDPLVAVFDSLDDERTLALYQQLKPLLDQAYRDLGYPGGDFGAALGQAIDRVLRAPLPDGDVEVERRVSNYRFADPELEALSAVEKLLIRMGPANARKVKAKLRLLRTSLD